MIRNLFFDLDDTLLDFRQAERNALSATFRANGRHVTDALLTRYAAINAEYWRRLERHEISRDELKVARFRDLFTECGIVGLSPSTFTVCYEAQLKDQYPLLTGARELLCRMRQKYRLYVASNGSGAVQRSRLCGAGISDFFAELFLSEEIGASKPSGAFFDACFARVPELVRAETVMIGDSLTSDIAGGQAAGLRTVWFNPENKENRTGILPDAEIHCPDQLDRVLEQF